ncbi:MAG TPA: hypothetical protein VK590_09295 [Saprospiraceae bacterium]|nr:hypothetical protein [Saprospiraceae bacterium]
MKKLLFYSLFFLTIISFSACNIEDVIDDSPCGLSTGQSIDVTPPYFFTSYGSFHHYTEGGSEVYQWSDIVKEVCTKEEVKTHFVIALKHPEKANLFTARGKVNYLVIFQNQIPLVYNTNSFSGDAKTGIGNGGSALQGSFIHEVELIFKSTGSFATDTTFIKENIEYIIMDSDFREYK